MLKRIEEFVNIRHLSKPNISLARPLMIFYIIIASNFTPNLFSRQLKDYIEESRIMQHIIGFTMLLTIMNMFAGLNDIQSNLLYTTIVYLWFILTTKLELQWNLLILFLLFIGYINESMMMVKEERVQEDKNIPKEVENRIKSQHDRIKTFILLSIICVTVLGTYQYFDKKNIQYGGSFDPTKYLFCSANERCHDKNYNKFTISLV